MVQIIYEYEKIIFRNFNIRNFEIPKYWSFYISSFQILTPTYFISFVILIDFQLEKF